MPCQITQFCAIELQLLMQVERKHAMDKIPAPQIISTGVCHSLFFRAEDVEQYTYKKDHKPKRFY